MKKVLILFGKKSWNKPAFPKKEVNTYQFCYQYLYPLAEKNGVFLFRASSAWYDKKKKIFRNAWTFRNNSWIRVHNIKPDLIYDKTRLSTETQHFKKELNRVFPIVNDLEFTTILDNKLTTSLLFSRFCKKHYPIKNQSDLKKALSEIRSDLVVFKTTTGSGGEDIRIIEKSKAKKIKIIPDLIAQEFIDSSKGIPGLVKSTHDLRLVFINNKLIYAYLRVPKKGSYLANISQGGSMISLENSQLPRSLQPIIEKIQETFSVFHPKVYTIDLMFDEKRRPWIVELNSMPGLFFSPDQKKYQDRMYLALINMFKKI
jgi:glutathione synthase/RimK-type ligase-like ATP-grasp enzyme